MSCTVPGASALRRGGANARQNGPMRRLAVSLVVIVLLVAALGAVPAAASGSAGESALSRTVGETTTTTTLPGDQPAATSPWVLVLIGAAAGAVVGVFTGLARRRRAQAGR